MPTIRLSRLHFWLEHAPQPQLRVPRRRFIATLLKFFCQGAVFGFAWGYALGADLDLLSLWP